METGAVILNYTRPEGIHTHTHAHGPVFAGGVVVI